VQRVLSETKVRKSKTKILILGDDLIALWPLKCNDLYSKLLEEYGMKISTDKHLCSKHYGNFARQFVRVEKEFVT